MNDANNGGAVVKTRLMAAQHGLLKQIPQNSGT